MAQWMAPDVHGGHASTLEKGSCTHTHTHTSLPFTLVNVDPSVCQASGTPSTRQSSIDASIWREEARGLARLHLSVSRLTALGGGGPPPFPAHQPCWQVQAGKGLPHHPIHAHQHIWWMWAGGGCPQSLSTVGQAHLCPGWAQAGAVSQSSLTGGGAARLPSCSGIWQRVTVHPHWFTVMPRPTMDHAGSSRMDV